MKTQLYDYSCISIEHRVNWVYVLLKIYLVFYNFQYTGSSDRYNWQGTENVMIVCGLMWANLSV